MPRIQINVYCEDYPVMDDAINHIYIKPKSIWMNLALLIRWSFANKNTFQTQLYHKKYLNYHHKFSIALKNNLLFQLLNL